MAYEMHIKLTDIEYTVLSKKAEKSGIPLEAFLHEVLTQYIQPSISANSQVLDRQNIQEYLYHEGVIAYLPTNETNTYEEDAEREYLAQLFGQGKPASEMVIEGRGLI